MKTTITINKNGISGYWFRPPFFSTIHKEISWNEIDNWKFATAGRSLVDNFFIKTVDGKTYSIRCLTFYSSQSELTSMVEAFEKHVEIYNEEHPDIQKKIITAPSLFESTFGLIFALALGISIIWFSYNLYLNPIDPSNGDLLVKAITFYIVTIPFVCFVGWLQFEKFKKKRQNYR